MAKYVRTTWVNAGAPPIDQANLNNIELQLIIASMREEGSHTVEQTTNNLAATDLSTVAGLAIPVDQWVLIVCQYRKTNGHASGVSIGLKINATEITVPQSAASGAIQNESGAVFFLLGPREANYLNSSGLMWLATYATGSGVATFSASNITAATPAAVITDVTIRGLVGNALNTVGTKNLYVYSFGG